MSDRRAIRRLSALSLGPFMRGISRLLLRNRRCSRQPQRRTGRAARL